MEKNLLVGLWRTDPADVKSIKVFGNVKMEFTENGKLIYWIEDNNKLQQLNMIYQVNGNLLITDQPSAPSREETIFEILPDGRLKLFMNGIESFYIKGVV
jgi:hypothetical protein